MELQRVEKEGFIIVMVNGRLDANTASKYESECLSYLDNGDDKVIVDLHGLEYISSAGLRSILTIGKKIKSIGGKYVFCNLQPMVAKVFKISGFNSIFPVYETLEDAIEEVKG
ncbi:STAS domain-containing protein [Desulfothermus okinawensis JCM 13304]